jgi:dihydroxyacetone synthase
MRACGWDMIDVHKGVNDVASIVSALEKGRDPRRTKPLFINIRTIVGVGSAVAGQAVAHGVSLGTKNVKDMKKAYGWDVDKKFYIPEKVKAFYKDLPSRGDGFVKEWEDKLAPYSRAYPDLAKTFKDRMDGKLPNDWESKIPMSFSTDPTPTHKSNNQVIADVLASILQLLSSRTSLWDGSDGQMRASI